jgi:SAM-dependent methyltransferase
MVTPGVDADYTIITERPGIRASREQLERIYQRYHFALPWCKGKSVVEVGCGTGQGLGYLARQATLVLGGDIEAANLPPAVETYKGRPGIHVIRLDAMALPVQSGKFDTVICYETIYYLPALDPFLGECRRVLKPGGTLVLCTVNREWPDFNPSPHSVRYLSARELQVALASFFTEVRFSAGFDVSQPTLSERGVSLIKRVAVAMHIIPKSMKGKEALKRLFFGRLVTLPYEILPGQFKDDPPVEIDPLQPVRNYKIVYAIGRKPVQG